MDEERPNLDATKLSTIRMKLEERRRHIEQEKRKMEFALSKQQQKVGKAAFLQAINKVSGLRLGFILYFFFFIINPCVCCVRICKTLGIHPFIPTYPPNITFLFINTLIYT